MEKNNYQGKFIVIEGLDGSGQSTQVSRLIDWLNEGQEKLVLGRPLAHLTKEPTNNMIGGLIRSRLANDWKICPEGLQLLFAADRAYHLEKEIIPLLEKGFIIITDRYFFSSIAYGAVEIKDTDWLIEINNPFILPDLAFFIKVSPEICLDRIKKTRFHVELFEKEEILVQVWQNYEDLAKRFENVYIIDGERPVEKVFEEVKNMVHSKLNL